MKALQAVVDPGFLTASFGGDGPTSVTTKVICEDRRPVRFVYCVRSNMLHCEHVYEATHADGRFTVQAKQRLRECKRDQASNTEKAAKSEQDSDAG